jgi:hypothetical protein
MNHTPANIVVVFAALTLLSGCVSNDHTQRADTLIRPSTVLTAAYAATPPNIDGIIDKPWDLATPLTVTVREAIGGGDPMQVVMRALHSDNKFYILAKWSDTTLSDMRDPYIWDSHVGQYARVNRPDDQFAIEFPLDGEFELNMLTTTGEYTADVWHWKAGRSNPSGWADDKRHLIGNKSVDGAKKYSLGGHGSVYIARPMDAGTPAYRRNEEPSVFTTDVINSFGFQQASGSVADVRAKGVHDGSGWTLEMVRKFDTGHRDDAVIHKNQDNRFAIAILDDELYWHHSISGLMLLRFSQE